jgi:hypothetical protein
LAPSAGQCPAQWRHVGATKSGPHQHHDYAAVDAICGDDTDGRGRDWKTFSSGRSLLHGSAWCRDSIRRRAKSDLAGSRSEAIDICVGCSSGAMAVIRRARQHGTKRLWPTPLIDRRPIKVAAVAPIKSRADLGDDGARRAVQGAELVAGVVTVGRQKSQARAQDVLRKRSCRTAR